MSPEEVLANFYDTVPYSGPRTAGRQAFDGERLRGVKLASDLVDAKTGEVVAEAGTKMTPRLIKKLQQDGLKDQLVQDEDLIGSYVATDFINEETGEVVCEAGDELTER